MAAKFKPDVIIAGDDGEIYHLSQTQLKRFKVAKGSSAGAEYQAVQNLLKLGVSSAAIPTTKMVNKKAAKAGAGKSSAKKPKANFIFACYLLNLASLKKHTRYED